MGYSLGWNNQLILTFDPNFQRDIQVGEFFGSGKASERSRDDDFTSFIREKQTRGNST